jgi:hypothetical protein
MTVVPWGFPVYFPSACAPFARHESDRRPCQCIPWSLSWVMSVAICNDPRTILGVFFTRAEVHRWRSLQCGNHLPGNFCHVFPQPVSGLWDNPGFSFSFPSCKTHASSFSCAMLSEKLLHEVFDLLGVYTAYIGSYRRFGTTHRSHLQGSSSPLKMGPIGYLETSVTKSDCSLRKMAEE